MEKQVYEKEIVKSNLKTDVDMILTRFCQEYKTCSNFSFPITIDEVLKKKLETPNFENLIEFAFNLL